MNHLRFTLPSCSVLNLARTFVCLYVVVVLFSEFDIAALVVHVGEVYTAAHQKRQWVFVTDSSISELQSEKLSNSLLAISFCSSYIDDNSYAPINYNLAGSTVSQLGMFTCCKILILLWLFTFEKLCLTGELENIKTGFSLIIWTFEISTQYLCVSILLLVYVYSFFFVFADDVYSKLLPPWVNIGCL